MSDKQTFILRTDNARARMAAAWSFACQFLELGQSVKVSISECKLTRTLEQNALMWAMLHDIARQVEWHVDGRLQLLEAEDWKDILTAGLRKNQRVAAGVEGGFVMLGERTSRMKVSEMIELIEFMYWFGAERDVVWSDPAEKREKAA